MDDKKKYGKVLRVDFARRAAERRRRELKDSFWEFMTKFAITLMVVGFALMMLGMLVIGITAG